MASKGKPAAKKTAKKKPAGKKTAANKRRPKQSRHQAAAVCLFAGAVFLLCLLLIPGEHVWKLLRDLLLGLFGVCAFVVPPLMAYIAVIAAMEKPQGFLQRKLWQGGLVLTAVGTVVQVFAADVQGTYFTALGAAWKNGQALSGGGFWGAVLGYPFEYCFTDIGAKIILCLLAFVAVMLMTGTSIINLFSALWKPVKKTGESIRSAIEYNDAEEERLIPLEGEAIDVDIGEGYSSKTAEELPPAPPAKSEPYKKFESAAREIREGDRFAYDMPLDGYTPPLEDGVPAPEAPPLRPEEKKELADTLTAAVEGSPVINSYRYPPISLLDESRPVDAQKSGEEQKHTAALLVNTLQEFGVSTKVLDVSRGPSVTRYELQPSAGVKISRITSLADDIALRLATTGVRIEAPIPNKAAVGIEVPNRVSQGVCLRELLDSPAFSQAKSRLTVALGKDITGRPVMADLTKMPHLLIAGTTGSGKSVCTNSMIQSILYKSSPEEVRMLLIDPKQVEFGIYNGIPHLLVPVVTDPRKAAGALGWAVTEMLRRYKLFAENNVRDLESYNMAARKSETMQPLPLILIVIDELSDLMMSAANEVEDAIVRLAQMARAAGMHLVIATQRPSVDVITGLIKANIPSRLALTVASAVDSRTIIDSGGAEKLLGRGDMLFMPVGVAKPMRVQGCFVSNQEVESVVSYLKASGEEQEYDETIIAEIDRQAEATGKTSAKMSGGDDDDMGDDMLPQAIQVAVENGSISTSMLQRKLRLGYARAGRIMDMMEQKGIIGPPEGSKPRQVLITRQQWLEMSLSQPESQPPVEEELLTR